MYLIDVKIEGEMGCNQKLNTVESFHGGIVEVVNDGNIEALVEKLNHSVGSNESGTSSHQNALSHTHH